MNDPENLVLQQLREIRAMQDLHLTRFDEVAQTLSGILTRLSGIERLLITLYGKVTEDEQRVARLEARIERLEALSK